MEEKYTNAGRKLFWINSRFQAKFMLFTTGIALILVGIFYGSYLWFFSRFREIGSHLTLPSDHAFFTAIAEQERTMSAMFLVAAIAAFVIVWISGLFFSHRISGPVYRLNHALRDLSVNDTTDELKFRDHDFFPELADSFNELRRCHLEAKGKQSR